MRTPPSAEPLHGQALTASSDQEDEFCVARWLPEIAEGSGTQLTDLKIPSMSHLAGRRARQKKGQRTPSISGARGQRAAPDHSRVSACNACRKKRDANERSPELLSFESSSQRPQSTTLEHSRARFQRVRRALGPASALYRCRAPRSILVARGSRLRRYVSILGRRRLRL